MAKTKDQLSAEREEQAQQVQEATREQEAQDGIKQSPLAVVIDTDIDPRLNPDSPEFDFAAWKESIAKAGGMDAMLTQLAKTINSIEEQIRAAVESSMPSIFRDNMQALLSYLSQFNLLQDLQEYFSEIDDLIPFLEKEIDKDQAFSDVTLEKILDDGFSVHGEPLKDSPYKELIERAKQSKADFEAVHGAKRELDQAKKEFPNIPRYKKTVDFKTSTDKLANVFFSLMAPAAEKEINGQRQMIPLKYEGKKAKKEITLSYDYIYNEDVLIEHGLNKKFDDFDFFVTSTSDNLFEAGNDVVSITKFFNEMGCDGKPTAKQLEKIYNSLLKGLTTTITIDDAAVKKAWGDNDAGATYHHIVSPVIPVQIGSERFIINGKIANCYIKINGLSPFMQVAKSLGHVTAWEKDVLRLYKGRRTERYYCVLRFLMQQIGWMRNSSRSNKITYSSLYEYTGELKAQPRTQQLTRDMMYRLLDEVFKAADYITAYKEEAEPTPGVVLTLSRKRLKSAAK